MILRNNATSLAFEQNAKHMMILNIRAKHRSIFVRVYYNVIIRGVLK